MESDEASQNFNTPIILVSYAISVLGAQTALELLGRRTDSKGLYNWFLLVSASLSMGAGGIWSMHFIGNNSLTLTYDSQTYQLVYSQEFTLISLLVAIVCMGLAFYMVGVAEEVRFRRILLGGIFGGSGVCAMHYCGQFAIAYFVVKYETVYIIAALLIGITATTIALWIFFELRAQWKEGWYKRTACAMIMGGAVCGMHYCGMIGTRYYMPNNTDGPPLPPIARFVLVGIIVAIVVSGCAVLVGIAIQGRREKDLVRQRARQIVLEIVVFDEWGKVLVTNDGILPMKDIDQKLYTKGRQLSVFEPVFNRLFESTRDWKELTSAPEPDYILRSAITEPLKPSEEDLFVRRFIDAAQQLANELKLCLFDIGILYDNVLNTGVIEKSKRSQRSSRFNPWANSDGESQVAMVADNPYMRGIPQFKSKGQHLFLVQKLRKGDTQRFTQHGYRFSDPIFISNIMASKLSVPRDVMLGYFHDLWSYATTGTEMRPEMASKGKGIYMGLLMVIQEKGERENLQIVVDKANRYSLPLVEIMGGDGPDSRPPLNTLEREYISSLFDKGLEEIASETTVHRLKFPNMSSSSPQSSTIPTNLHHFTRAISQAARHLLDITNLPHSPATKAILHPSIIDLPRFSLTRSASQLLLFTCRVPSADLGAAINDDQVLKVYCLPWKFHQSFWRFVSDAAFREYVAQSRAKLQQQQQQQQQTVEFQGSARSLPPPPRPGLRMHRIMSSVSSASSTASEIAKKPIDPRTSIAMSDIYIGADDREELLLSANRMQWLIDIVEGLSL